MFKDLTLLRDWGSTREVWRLTDDWVVGSIKSYSRYVCERNINSSLENWSSSFLIILGPTYGTSKGGGQRIKGTSDSSSGFWNSSWTGVYDESYSKKNWNPY